MNLLQKLNRLKIWDDVAKDTYKNPKVVDNQVDPDPSTDEWHPPMEEDEKINTGNEIQKVQAELKKSNLNENNLKLMQKGLEEYQCIFGNTELGSVTDYSVGITMKPDYKEWHSNTRAGNSEFEEREMNKQIMNLWKKGFIEESDSHVSSNLLLVKKAGSSKLRLCTNLVKCNDQCMQVDEKLPTLEQGLSKLGKKKIFSVIDLRQGFWQIPVEEDSRKFLAFKTPSGLFQWKVMPFGLKTAPAYFTKSIRRMLSAKYGDSSLHERLGPGALETLAADPYAFAYMDDIVIYSDDEESHTQHVLDIMRRIKEFGLKISAEKTHLFKK